MGSTQVINGALSFFDDSKSYDLHSTIEPRNIMLTGYWNPTGQMIAPFSNNTYLNPDGWKGGNWEGWGFNVYSFFPTPGLYNGTFEVDYQDTWDDFWNITSEIRPIAIISFGAGDGPWEIECNARNLPLWIPDEKPPRQPTPCPPDRTVAPGYVRHATLPVQLIADAVNSQTAVEAWVDWDGNPGAYLCEYMAYLGMWYQAIHSDIDDPYRCVAAGFIHVKANIALEDAMNATNVTLRETIKFLINTPPDPPVIDGPTEGKAGQAYNYTFVSTDAECNDLSYMIEWGDGREIVVGLYPSGEEVTVSHTWSKGTYTIRAKAVDVFGAESKWSELEVTMPKNKEAVTLFLDFIQQRFPRLFLLLNYLLSSTIQTSPFCNLLRWYR
jgi:pyrrolidone-carboxylate peptidase